MVTTGHRSSVKGPWPAWLWVAAAGAIVGGTVPAVLVLDPAFAPVVIEGTSFQYDTPPTVLCPFVVTVGGPPAVFPEARGHVFTLAWEVGCAPSGTNTTAPRTTYQLTPVSSSTWGSSVVRPDVPFVFNDSRFGSLIVSVRAPL